jgi:hypothetical protein
MVNATKIGPRMATHRKLTKSARLAACGTAASLLSLCFLLGGCQASRTDTHVTGPAIEFTGVPAVSRSDSLGDAAKLSMIKGRVIGARPGQQIVVYAHAIDGN